jgi:hypothetical protein
MGSPLATTTHGVMVAHTTDGGSDAASGDGEQWSAVWWARVGRVTQGAIITVVDGWQVGPFNFFLQFSNPPTLKFQMMVFPLSKIHQTLQGDNLKHEEQISYLAQLQNPSIFWIIKYVNNSYLNLPWILKGFKTFGKNLINSLNLCLEIIFMNVNLDGQTCMQEFGVSIQGPFWLGLK